MQRTLLQLCLATLLLCLWGCRQSTEPAPAQLRLTAEAGVVEAWLTINVENAADAEVLITRDGAERLRFPAVAETTVVDTGLLPAHNYSYAARLVRNGQTKARSNSVQLTTMDTTSHEFQWQIYEFGGQHGSSVLYDVAIINENDIWAVGEIHTAETDTFDSLGNWVNPYNAVHWNGSEWELKRIRTNTCGGVDYPPIKTIFSFSADDILFAHIDASITHYDGQSFLNDCSFIQQINGSINKIWGISSEDFYVVGGAGLIAHYDGSGWRRIESGTETTIQDIWGAQDPRTGEWVILCAVSPGYGISNPGILKINQNQTVEVIPWVSGRAARSVWFESPDLLFACGSGILRRTPLGIWEEIGGVDVIPANTERLRGLASNDIFIVSDFGHIAHYNGIDFNVIQPNSAILYFSCDYKNNLMVAVGGARKAYITKMWR